MTRLLALFTAALISISNMAHATMEGGVTTFSLDNGLEVVVIEDHRAPVVTHMVWYRVGAADDPQGKSGLAHYLEHLMFSGTDDIAFGEFDEIIEVNGGNDNAFTSYDYTAYFQRVAKDRLPLMMQLEADRMRDLVLNEKAVDREREIILEERGSRVDRDPGAIFSEQRSAALYLNHPYGRPIIGWRHEIEGLDGTDAEAFYRTYYAPNNAILVVAGDVRPGEVRELAEKHFGPLAPTPDLASRQRPQEPPQLAERRVNYSDPRVSQDYAIRTYLAPNRESGNQAEAAALTVLAAVLGGDITSHLTQVLQYDEKIVIDSGAFYSASGIGPGTFGVYVVPAEGVPLEQAEARLDAALDAFVDAPLDPEKLERIKTRIRANDIYALDSQMSRAQRYGAALASGLTVADVEGWSAVLTKVTAEDVRAAALNVLDRRRSVTGYLTGAEVSE